MDFQGLVYDKSSIILACIFLDRLANTLDQSILFQQKRQAFEQKAAILCGQKIINVRYQDIVDEGFVNWNYFGERFDNPVFGVEFTFENGKTLGITWASDFTNYNLSLYHEFSDGDGVIDITTTSRWSDYLHKTISSVILYWGCWVRINNDIETEEWHPEEIELTFESGDQVVISVAQIVSLSKPDEIFRPGDEIMIFFGDASASKYQAGRYSPLAIEEPDSISVICNTH